MEKEPVEPAGPEPGPGLGKVEKQYAEAAQPRGEECSFCTRSSFSLIPMPIPNPRSLLRFLETFYT